MSQSAHRISSPLIAAGALVLSFLFALSFFFVAAPAAHASREYGSLCSQYESGNDPNCIDPNCAYGAYQMSTGPAHAFSSWLKGGAGRSKGSKAYKMCVRWGKSLSKAYHKDGCCGSRFDAAWKKCGVENTTAFFNLQYEYCKSAYYDEAVSMWESVAPGFSPSHYTAALRSCLFSTAIQHGPYGSSLIFKAVCKKLGGYKKKLAESLLINEIYYERSRVSKKAPASGAIKITAGNCSSYAWSCAKSYKITNTYAVHFYSCSADVQVAVYNRLHNNERKDALRLLRKSGGCSHASKTGGVRSIGKKTDSTHTVKVSPVTCRSCGKILVAGQSLAVKHEFVAKGADYKCACGKSFTVHEAGAYYKAKKRLKAHRSRSAWSGTAFVLKKGTLAKVTKTVLASDGFWWGRVSGPTGKKRGWVRLCELRVHGTASGGHVFAKNGRCKYCKAKKETLRQVRKPGSYLAAGNLVIYKAAYSFSSKTGKVKAGHKVRIKKVVVNRFHDRWGMVRGGGFVKLAWLKALPKKTTASGKGTDTDKSEDTEADEGQEQEQDAEQGKDQDGSQDDDQGQEQTEPGV